MACEVITLNVGGTIYTTTKSTLTKYKDSMLACMFSDNFMPTKLRDANGHYFIDRDGRMFQHILNFLRAGILSLPEGFRDFELLETETDFYQITPLLAAIKSLTKDKMNGSYLEILDFEESAYFSRFYSDPPRGIHTELKNGGIVISGATEILKEFPLPEKVLVDLQTGDEKYKTFNISKSVNISGSSCIKMTIIHHLDKHGWKLLSSSFVNSTDSDGSYMVHKYIWHLPRQHNERDNMLS